MVVWKCIINRVYLEYQCLRWWYGSVQTILKELKYISFTPRVKWGIHLLSCQKSCGEILIAETIIKKKFKCIDLLWLSHLKRFVLFCKELMYITCGKVVRW